MAKRSRSTKKKRLSKAEIELLSMLWEHGPLTLAEAHQALGRPLGYTTVQTRLNRLVEKRVLTRTTTRPAKYEAAMRPEDVSAGHLDDLVDRVTGGNIVPLVAHLVQDRNLSKDQLAQLKDLIREAEQRSKKGK